MSEARPDPPSIPAPPSGEVGFQELILKELKGLGRAPDETEPLAAELLKQNLFGLALSGGGIRSATFALGVIQHLAQLNLVRRLDYLSAVSGGGYLNSWLAAWIKREGTSSPVQEVERKLVPRPEPAAPVDDEAQEILWLRRFGKYLAPKSALFSADTWTIFAIWLRNTMLNLIVLIAFLSAVLTIPWIVTITYHVLSCTEWASRISAVHVILAILATLCAAAGSRYSGRQGLNAPMGMIAAGLLWGSSVLHVYGPGGADRYLLMAWGASLAIICVWGMVTDLNSGFWRILGRSVLGIGLAGWGMSAAPGLLEPIQFASGFLAPIVVPPLISFLYCLLLALLMGMLGRHVTDERREWWSRAGAWLFITGTVWLLLAGVVLLGPSLIDFLKSRFVIGIATGSLWAAATGVGVWLGRSSSTNGKGESKSPVAEALLPVLPVVFVAGLLVLLSSGLASLVLTRQPIPPLESIVCQDCPRTVVGPGLGETWTHVWQSFRNDVLAGPVSSWWPLGLFGIFVFIYVFLGRLIDVNEFSMHRFYRNRLVRAFQGASRGRDRQADSFTNLDPKDELKITDLQKESGYSGPIHLVNTAVNLNLATTGMDERRAASFVFTPYGCGYSLRREPSDPESESTHHCRFYPQDSDLGLGTPVTASGAAASPNMGYHTSTTVAFLLTVFNVRLGYWMLNTRERNSLGSRISRSKFAPRWLSEITGWSPRGPKNGQVYFISELLALANKRRKYIYLSDGGHFENLGVYELLRRRCRYIICVDGEQDQNMKFEALAGLIRRARADLGIEIRINTSDIEERTAEGWSRSHCAVGHIVYPEEAGTGKDAYLLYIKLSVTGDEAVDILNYRKANPLFPHQSTGDQFFNESQFESYRKLGFHAANRTFRSVRQDPPKNMGGLDQIFIELWNTWYGMPRTVTASFIKHTETLDALLSEMQTDDKLQSLHASLNRRPPGTAPPPVPSVAGEYRACFYFCQRLIQLMENVYLDLDLESNFENPACQGWMEQFKDWALSPMFQETYSRTKHTFGLQFVSFFGRHFEKLNGLDRSA